MSLSNWNFLYTDTQYHVHESNKWENRMGYLRTLPCSPVPDGDYGVYAMDCEMVGSALITSTQTCVLGQNTTHIHTDILPENFQQVNFLPDCVLF